MTSLLLSWVSYLLGGLIIYRELCQALFLSSKGQTPSYLLLALCNPAVSKSQSCTCSCKVAGRVLGKGWRVSIFLVACLKAVCVCEPYGRFWLLAAVEDHGVSWQLGLSWITSSERNVCIAQRELVWSKGLRAKRKLKETSKPSRHLLPALRHTSEIKGVTACLLCN